MPDLDWHVQTVAVGNPAPDPITADVERAKASGLCGDLWLTDFDDDYFGCYAVCDLPPHSGQHLGTIQHYQGSLLAVDTARAGWDA